jgi:hypothetical protein
LRQCSALLFRLCDPWFCLEKVHLSSQSWFTFSKSLLDEERVVSEAVVSELATYLKGTGVYGKEGSTLPSKAPSLRFASLVCLCSDGDRGSEDDDASVGKLTYLSKNAAGTYMGGKAHQVSNERYQGRVSRF